MHCDGGKSDRHGENILIDVMEGGVVHVDFNLIFHKGEYLPVRERARWAAFCVDPQHVVNGFVIRRRGSFRGVLPEATLRRDGEIQGHITHRYSNIRPRSAVGMDKHRGTSSAEQRAWSVETSCTVDGKCTVDPKTSRRPYIVVSLSCEVYKHKFSCAPMSLEGQVAKLIDIASDEKNLAQMYIGWGPFI
ncbi:FATC domain protein [Cooperia oncophora]